MHDDTLDPVAITLAAWLSLIVAATAVSRLTDQAAARADPTPPTPTALLDDPLSMVPYFPIGG